MTKKNLTCILVYIKHMTNDDIYILSIPFPKCYVMTDVKQNYETLIICVINL